jgi:hypothetical protein
VRQIAPFPLTFLSYKGGDDSRVKTVVLCFRCDGSIGLQPSSYMGPEPCLSFRLFRSSKRCTNEKVKAAAGADPPTSVLTITARDRGPSQLICFLCSFAEAK